MPTEVFTIKPLEWEEVRRSNPFWMARPLPDVQYQVGWVGGDLPIRWLKVGVREADGRCASPEEGKRLAELHWQSYIKQALKPVGSCLWKHDPDGYWKTGCGNAFIVNNEEDLISNGFHFCHACGKPIEEQALVPVEGNSK